MSHPLTLRVRHTESYRNTPLACIENMPGPDPDLSPAQLRALAKALQSIADDCEMLHRTARRYGPHRREYAA
jgi:hypothetical protein